jgi:hypothetical protein
VIEGALLREEELAKRIMKAQTPGPVLMEREDRGKLSEEKTLYEEGRDDGMWSGKLQR